MLCPTRKNILAKVGGVNEALIVFPLIMAIFAISKDLGVVLDPMVIVRMGLKSLPVQIYRLPPTCR